MLKPGSAAPPTEGSSIPAPRVILLNPNTSREATAQMLEIAREAAGADLVVTASTASEGSALITDVESLRLAEATVLRLARQCLGAKPDGVVVAAFGDPALSALRGICPCPVVGIAEASMIEAAAGGRRFAVATTTPLLADTIRAQAMQRGFGASLTSVRTTPGDPAELMLDPSALNAALSVEIRKAIEIDGAEAVIIGGGPLARAARALLDRFDIPIIEPIPAAIRQLIRML